MNLLQAYIFGSCKVSCIHCATPAKLVLFAGLPHEFVKTVFLFCLFQVGKVCQISLQLMIICVLSVGVAYIMPYARTCHLQYLCICFLVALHNVSKLTHMIFALWFLESRGQVGKCGAATDEDPFVNVKGFIINMIAISFEMDTVAVHAQKDVMRPAEEREGCSMHVIEMCDFCGRQNIQCHVVAFGGCLRTRVHAMV